MKPTLSIVIPAYNVSEYIEEALESLRAQSMPPDEIIIIDDGSADDTLEKINSFSFENPVIVRSQLNQGQGAARNLGVSLASSDYVYFFDADDLVSSDLVETVKNLISGLKCPDLLLFSGGVVGSSSSAYQRGITIASSLPLNTIQALKSDRYSSSCSPCLYIFRRLCWISAQLSFSGNYFEDEVLFYPLIMSSCSTYVVDIVLFYRRIRVGSTMTMRPGLKHVLGALDGINSTARMLQGELDPGVRQILADRMLFFAAKYLDMCLKVDQSPRLALLFSNHLPLRYRMKILVLLCCLLFRSRMKATR